LERTKQALQSAERSKATAPPVTVFLGALGPIEVPYIRNMGPISTLNRFSESGAIWRKLVTEDTAVLITASSENMIIKVNLDSILGVGQREVRENLPSGRALLVQEPNYETDIDAPRLIESGYSGIIIHGNSVALEEIDNLLRDCFITRQTKKTVEGLAEYYKAKNLIWIEIGKGSPWKNPSSCWE
jgi:hypothetical protein